MSMPIDTIINKEDNEILTESGYYWREHNGVKILVSRSLEEAGFTNAFSTRLGGVSDFQSGSLNLAGYNEDLAENIEENRKRFLAAIGGDYTLATVWQVHGDDIKIVDNINTAEDSDQKFDGLISVMPGILAGVKTADCVPVLIGDPVVGAFAAAHAGWRGTLSSISEKSVKRLTKTYGCDPATMVAAIGPAATCRSYEIGQDVIDAFAVKFSTSGKYFTPTRDGHAFVDLHSVNRDQLINAGLQPENISIAPYCTMERDDLFFSYRKEKSRFGKTGRLLSVIGRANTAI